MVSTNVLWYLLIYYGIYLSIMVSTYLLWYLLIYYGIY